MQLSPHDVWQSDLLVMMEMMMGSETCRTKELTHAAVPFSLGKDQLNSIQSRKERAKTRTERRRRKQFGCQTVIIKSASPPHT